MQALKSLMGFWPTTNGVMVIKVKAKPLNMNLIQDAPTSSSSDEKLEGIYNNIDDCLKQCKSYEITIVVGDVSARVGVEKHANIAGGKGTGSRNERSEQLIECCEKNDQIISNT